MQLFYKGGEKTVQAYDAELLNQEKIVFKLTTTQ